MDGIVNDETFDNNVTEITNPYGNVDLAHSSKIVDTIGTLAFKIRMPEGKGIDGTDRIKFILPFEYGTTWPMTVDDVTAEYDPTKDNLFLDGYTDNRRNCSVLFPFET